MRLIAVLVEGQTEESFVGQVLADYLERHEVYLQPIIVQTSRTAGGSKHRGGGTSWKHFKNDLDRLTRDSHWSMITTMIDFYGYPADAPGADCATPHRHPDCVRTRARAMTSAVGDPRFHPYLMVHEFEMLVFAAALSRQALLGDERLVDQLRKQTSEFNNQAELINDSPDSAPSKRLQQLLPGYDKIADGIAMVDEAGIDQVTRHCPGFNSWVQRLLP